MSDGVNLNTNRIPDANVERTQPAPPPPPAPPEQVQAQEPTPAPPQPSAPNPMGRNAPGSATAQPSKKAEELPVPGPKTNEASDKAWGDSGAKALNPGDKFKLGGGDFPKGFDEGTVVANHKTSDLKAFDKMADVAALEEKLKSFDGKSNEFKSFLKDALANSDAKLTEADVTKYTDRKAGNEYGAAGAVMSEDGKGIKLQEAAEKGKYFEIGYGKEGSERSYAKVYLNDLAKAGAGSTVPLVEDHKASSTQVQNPDASSVKSPLSEELTNPPAAKLLGNSESKEANSSLDIQTTLSENDLSRLNDLKFVKQNSAEIIQNLKDGQTHLAEHYTSATTFGGIVDTNPQQNQYYNLGGKLFWGEPGKQIAEEFTGQRIASIDFTNGNFKLKEYLQEAFIDGHKASHLVDDITTKLLSNIGSGNDVKSLYQSGIKITPENIAGNNVYPISVDLPRRASSSDSDISGPQAVIKRFIYNSNIKAFFEYEAK